MDEELIEDIIEFIDEVGDSSYRRKSGLYEYIEDAVQQTYNEMLTASKNGKDIKKVFQRHLNRLFDKFPDIEDTFGFEEAFWKAVE
tara:strand:+ start:166 stop:423 length:258 start_codon:yes stop_codon:yes gene_type:complete